jgi:hypothetical protein
MSSGQRMLLVSPSHRGLLARTNSPQARQLHAHVCAVRTNRIQQDWQDINKHVMTDMARGEMTVELPNQIHELSADDS